MTVTMRVTQQLLMAATLALVGACGADPDTPEGQIRALIDRVEQDAEARDHSDVMAAVSPDFSNPQGGDYERLAKLLRLHFLRNQKIHLFVRIDELDVKTDDYAEAQLTIAMTGEPAENIGAVMNLNADLRQLDLRFVKADQWQVVWADWGRGGGR